MGSKLGILILFKLVGTIKGGVSYIEGGGVRGARIQEKGGGVRLATTLYLMCCKLLILLELLF